MTDNKTVDSDDTKSADSILTGYSEEVAGTPENGTDE